MFNFEREHHFSLRYDDSRAVTVKQGAVTLELCIAGDSSVFSRSYIQKCSGQ